jgi:hypothetical protein
VKTKARRRFPTSKPALSEATIARVRAAAHRYVMAGGSVFFNDESDGDHDQHVGNIERLILKGDAQEEFEAVLKADVTDHETHERLWTAEVHAKACNADAAFLFGAMVAFELMALPGQTIAGAVSPRKRRKAGAA